MKVQIIILSSVLVLSACHKKDPRTSDEPIPVQVTAAVTDSVTLHTQYPGTLYANKAVDVVCRVNGQLQKVLYKEGSYVRAGQPLFIMESTTYANAVSEAKAALSNAQSAYAYASRNYAAMQKALEKDAVAEMEVLQAKSAMEEAQAQIRSARARLSDASTMLGYCTVRAPFSGYVSASKFDPGAYIGGQAEPVTMCSMYDNTSMQIHFSVEDEQGLASVADSAASRYGLDLKHIPVTFQTALGHPYTASLDYVAPDIDAGTGTMLLKASIKNPAGELKQGMFCTISLPYRTLPKAVLVRDASISTDQRGKFLYVVNDSDKVVYTPVTVSELFHDSLRVVTSGIRPGQRYVTSAILKVRDGMTVKPM